MRNFILFLALCTSLCASSYGQSASKSEYDENITKAEAFYNKKEYKQSAEAYNEAFKTLSWKGTQKDRYNAARSWAMAKVPDSAFFDLHRIAEKTYYNNINQISEEPDFKSLHKDARWQPLLDVVSKNNENKLPDGWFRAGSKPAAYFMSIDKALTKNNDSVITIRSVDKSINGFGTVMNNFSPEKYLGKRIKMTGYLKTKDVQDWAGFWLRIDGEELSKSLAFDNMKNGKTDRSVKGTTEWKKYEVVLDVSEDAKNIACGALMGGTGQIWFDKITLQIVDDNTETTGLDAQAMEPEKN